VNHWETPTDWQESIKQENGHTNFEIYEEIISQNVITKVKRGACGNVVVKALCYKKEGRGFETRGGE
jgi:hypothetical protein